MPTKIWFCNLLEVCLWLYTGKYMYDYINAGISLRIVFEHLINSIFN